MSEALGMDHSKFSLNSLDEIRFSEPFSYTGLKSRDCCHCRFCGQQVNDELFNNGRGADPVVCHLLIPARGGDTCWTNCVLACFDCCKKKGKLTPEEANMPVLPLSNPAFQEITCNVTGRQSSVPINVDTEFLPSDVLFHPAMAVRTNVRID